MSKKINPKVPIFSLAVTRSRSKKDLIIAVLSNEATVVTESTESLIKILENVQLKPDDEEL